MSNLTFMNANKSKESRNFVLNYIKGIQIPAKLFQFRNSGGHNFCGSTTFNWRNYPTPNSSLSCLRPWTRGRG